MPFMYQNGDETETDVSLYMVRIPHCQNSYISRTWLNEGCEAQSDSLPLTLHFECAICLRGSRRNSCLAPAWPPGAIFSLCFFPYVAPGQLAHGQQNQAHQRPEMCPPLRHQIMAAGTLGH